MSNMVARFVSDMSFVCPRCGKANEHIDVPVPGTNWTGDNADERFTQDQVEIDCPSCHQDFVVDVQNSDGRIFARLEEHPNVEIKASHAWMEEEVDPADIPDDREIILFATLADVRDVIRTSNEAVFNDTLHRMAFIQQFAALEAYLADTLVGEVLNKPGALHRLILGDKQLREMRLSLSAVHANPDVVKHEVVRHLRELLYHNFAKVEVIWGIALQFPLFPDEEVRTRMMRAEPIRHDCVHRNGKDKSGKDRLEVDEGFLWQMEYDLKAIADHIEKQLPGVE